eukprot:scaffold227_cov309-Prasinococcus_capsulatus_cf.AAC.2
MSEGTILSVGAARLPAKMGFAATHTTCGSPLLLALPVATDTVASTVGPGGTATIASPVGKEYQTPVPLD